MSKSLYIQGNTAIINFTEDFCRSTDELVSSKGFRIVLNHYLTHIKQEHQRRYEKLTKGFTHDETIDHMIELISQLRIKPLDQIDSYLIEDLSFTNKVVEDIYHYWRSFERCSIMYTRYDLIELMDYDTRFNDIVLRFYRTIQEKIQGRKNKVYRQLKAGTNAAVRLKRFDNPLPESYKKSFNTYFIDSVLLHSPLILHPKTNKREGHFQEVFENPLQDVFLDSEKFFCYPAKVGSLLAHIYFHRDFMFSGLSLANLFELADQEEVNTIKPDLVIAFGVEDSKEDMVFYHDKQHDIVVGKISYQSKIEYFGYLKKITLTAYNVAMMARGWVPIHGAMVNVTFNDGKRRGVVFMGDSGAGKSETLEELTAISKNTIARMDVVFDDMGSFHASNKGVVAQGTEIGAFVRLDDLDRGLPYKEMDRSIFMNPESTVNARVIVPATTAEIVASDHPVDFFLYANNYDKKIGVEVFAQPSDGKEIFIDGKRMAKGTTHETGITTSFFANPFGPLQQEDKCRDLIDELFIDLAKHNVVVGQVFTNLGVDDAPHDALKQSAQAVLKLLEEN